MCGCISVLGQWEVGESGEECDAVVVRKTSPRVMHNRETRSQTPCNVVFNIIFRYFRYDITPYSDDNKCYRRS